MMTLLLRRALVGLCLALAGAPLAHAQDAMSPTTARALELLALVPADPLTEADRLQIELGDPAAALPAMALAQISGPLNLSLPAGSLMRTLPGDMRAFFDPGDEAGMRAAMGIGHGAIAGMVAVSDLPERLVVFDLRPGTGAGIPAALAAAGHQEGTRAAGVVWARGGEDYAVDPEGRDRANLFGGAFGLASRIAIAGDTVAWSPAFDPVDRFQAGAADGGASLADDPRLRALFAALAPEVAGSGQLAYAFALLERDPATGVPDMMIADLVHGVEDRAVFVALAADEASARRQAAYLAALWADGALPGLGAYAEAAPEAPVTVMPGRPAAVILTLAEARAPYDPPFVSRPISALFNLMMMADTVMMGAE